jgi:hypothetical protein
MRCRRMSILGWVETYIPQYRSQTPSRVDQCCAVADQPVGGRQVHPHCEDYGIRVRIERFFQVYNRLPLYKVHHILRNELKTTHLVLTRGPCHLQCPPKIVFADLLSAANSEPISPP